ncbi:hypothetical protein BH18THE1_BH18THE1_00830 [soil metagenome]
MKLLLITKIRNNIIGQMVPVYEAKKRKQITGLC